MKAPIFVYGLMKKLGFTESVDFPGVRFEREAKDGETNVIIWHEDDLSFSVHFKSLSAEFLSIEEFKDIAFAKEMLEECA